MFSFRKATSAIINFPFHCIARYYHCDYWWKPSHSRILFMSPDRTESWQFQHTNGFPLTIRREGKDSRIYSMLAPSTTYRTYRRRIRGVFIQQYKTWDIHRIALVSVQRMDFGRGRFRYLAVVMFVSPPRQCEDQTHQANINILQYHLCFLGLSPHGKWRNVLITPKFLNCFKTYPSWRAWKSIESQISLYHQQEGHNTTFWKRSGWLS